MLLYSKNNDGTILFATSRNSEKVEQMKQNPNIALATGNIKIEAIAELFGTIYPEKTDDLLIVAKPRKIS